MFCGVQNTLGSPIVCQDCCLLWRSSFWLFRLFLAVLVTFDLPYVFFEVLIVSDWFHRVPWHVRSPEHLENLTLPTKKRVKTVISFENSQFAILALFGCYWCSRKLIKRLHGLRLVSHGTLAFEKSWITWGSPITLKNVWQDFCIFWKSSFLLCVISIFCRFRLFFTFLTASLNSSLSLIGSLPWKLPCHCHFSTFCL